VNSQLLGFFFQNLCGRWSDKKIPKFSGSLRQLKIAADACLMGDGSFEKTRSVLSTCSLQIALWFRDIMYASGNNVSFRLQLRSNRKPSYRISVLKTSKKDRKVKTITQEFYTGKVFNLGIANFNEFYTLFGLVHNCGWHPSVNLEDIKLKVVQNLGENAVEYDLWSSQAQSLENKPYINDEAIEEVLEPEAQSPEEMKSNIEDLLMTNRIKGHVFTRRGWGQAGVTVNIDHMKDEDYE